MTGTTVRRLSEHAISTLKEKYFEAYNIQLTDDEANEKGLDLLQFMKVIYRPIPKGENNGTN